MNINSSGHYDRISDPSLDHYNYTDMANYKRSPFEEDRYKIHTPLSSILSLYRH